MCLQVWSELFKAWLLWMLKQLLGKQTYFSLVFNLFHLRHSSLTASWRDAETLRFKLPDSLPTHSSSRLTEVWNYYLIRMEKDWRWRPYRQIPLISDAILACFDHVTRWRRKCGNVTCCSNFWPLGDAVGH